MHQNFYPISCSSPLLAAQKPFARGKGPCQGEHVKMHNNFYPISCLRCTLIYQGGTCQLKGTVPRGQGVKIQNNIYPISCSSPLLAVPNYLSRGDMSKVPCQGDKMSKCIKTFTGSLVPLHCLLHTKPYARGKRPCQGERAKKHNNIYRISCSSPLLAAPVRSPRSCQVSAGYCPCQAENYFCQRISL